MRDFTYLIPTKILFGKNQVQNLGGELPVLGKKILLVYGTGSIKKTGIYDTVVSLLQRESISFYELSAVQPNPRISSVREGISLCRTHQIDGILAVGGGSVIDCAKTIATGFYYEGDPWELFLRGDSSIQKALPLGTVLTVAGTGSEMNGNAVVSNEDTKQKLAIHHDVLRPRFSILDPTLTFTVSREQTAAGVVDIFSHVLEQYFSPTRDAFVQSRLAEGLLLTCRKYGHIAVEEPANYDARAQVMWASSLALNGLLSYGRVTDWATHGIEHAVSAVYDVTHGVGLAVLTPFWMDYVLDTETVGTFVDYAQNVWQVPGGDEFSVAKQGIEKTREFFTSLGMPRTLQEIGVQQEKLKELAEKTVSSHTIGRFKKLDKNDVLRILQNAYA
jgi:alcohol dehydrogenase YqhD (iron-dependent ADH family)